MGGRFEEYIFNDTPIDEDPHYGNHCMWQKVLLNYATNNSIKFHSYW